MRAFRKFLFDSIGIENLVHDGAWVGHGADWAFMIHIVEQAGADIVRELRGSLYFYEECALHTRSEKHTELERAASNDVLRRTREVHQYHQRVTACAALSGKPVNIRRRVTNKWTTTRSSWTRSK